MRSNRQAERKDILTGLADGPALENIKSISAAAMLKTAVEWRSFVCNQTTALEMTGSRFVKRIKRRRRSKKHR